MSSLMRPGGSRRDQVVLRQSKPDLDRMTLDNAQNYLTTPPAVGGGVEVPGGGGGAFSTAASGQVLSVSGTTATVSCAAPISKNVVAQNYTGKVLAADDLVFVTGIIDLDAGTETYSVVSVYQGSGVPTYADPPFGDPSFPRAMTNWPYDTFGAGLNYRPMGAVVCRINDSVPAAIVVRRESAVNSTSVYNNVYYMDLLSSTIGTMPLPDTMYNWQSGTKYTTTSFHAYGDGFAAYRGINGYHIYVWNPYASGGVGGFVTVPLPYQLGDLYNGAGIKSVVAGVGEDGALWSVFMFRDTLGSYDLSYPAYVRAYKWVTSGDLYDGTWTLMNSVELPTVQAGYTGSGATFYSTAVMTGSGRVFMSFAKYGRTSSPPYNITAEVVTSGSAPITQMYPGGYYGIDSTYRVLGYTAWGTKAVYAGTVDGFVVLTLYSPDGSNQTIYTSIPTVGQANATYNSDGKITVTCAQAHDGGGYHYALYRVTESGYSTLVYTSPYVGTSTGGSVWSRCTLPGPVTSPFGDRMVALMPRDVFGTTSTNYAPLWLGSQRDDWAAHLYEL